jgi:Sigma-70, region 4
MIAVRHQRRWTTEEDQFLKDHVGIRSFDYMAKKLGRTPYAIERRLEKLGLLNTKLAGGWLSGNQLAEILGVESSVVYRWRDKHNLPLKKKRLRYNKTAQDSYYITVEDFWKWAKDHQDKFNATKVDTDFLIPVPDWFYKKHQEDLKIPQRTKQYWTTEEDRKVWKLYYEMGMKQKEIAIILNRSQNAVEKRLKRLRILKGIS